MVALSRNTAFLVAVGLLSLAAASALPVSMSPARAADATDDKRWQAVAPGQVEPASGEIKIVAPVVGRIGEVLVKPNDKAFAGELLIRLDDQEVRARVAAAEAKIAPRKRARNDQNPSRRAGDRRRAEDSVADAERAIVDARAALDRAAAARRSGSGSEQDVTAARTALARAQDRLVQQLAELRRVEADTTTPLPSRKEGELNVARAQLQVARAALEKLVIRAPIAGTVLQVNAKAGELATPSSLQPLIVLGDISALRVRVELDERDFGEIRVGQSVLVRPLAFAGEIGGKVSSIGPIVEPGRITRAQRNVSDVNVAAVVIDLAETGPLAVGMNVDVYFQEE
jgi:HlyD family secretion protein